MANHITQGAIKVIEVIGVSKKSSDDAVAEAVKKASETVKGISGVEVTKHMASVKDGKIVQYRANVKLAFVVD